MVDNAITANPETVNDDFWIAIYLGFNCSGHNYQDYLNARIVINYVDKQDPTIVLLTEVCEKNKCGQDIKKQSKLLLDRINKILNQLDFMIELHFELDEGVNTRYEKLLNNDITFLNMHKYDYINDLENFYIADGSILARSVSYQKLIDIQLTTKVPGDIHRLALLYYNACIHNYFDTYYTQSDNFATLLEFAINYWDTGLDFSTTVVHFKK